MIEYLNWDSDFLKLKTGLINTSNADILSQSLLQAREENYQLIYVYGDQHFFPNEIILQRYSGKLVDRKVIYEKFLNANNIGNYNRTKLYNSKHLNESLIKLAYESGKFSRFKLDSGFPEHVFKNMYHKWILNSVNGTIANYVYVLEENNQTLAMVTLKVENHILKIGLIATLPEYQGKGCGKQLINRAIQTAMENSLNKIEVPTQLNNKQACNFYESCGFSIKSISNIYHFWL